MLSLDLHIHSHYSFDSLMNPNIILKNAKYKKLDVIAITDHNTIAGGLNTYKKSKDFGVNVIIGSEIATTIGDIIGLFLYQEIKSRNIFEVIEEIKSQDGIILLPHPFKSHNFMNIKQIIDNIDLIEYFNSRHPINIEQIMLLKSLNKPLVAGSDAHFIREIGLCRNIMDDKFSSIENIRKNLLNNNYKIKGNYGRPYFESGSQIIKSIKSHNVKLLYLSTGKFIISMCKYSIYNKKGKKI